MNRQVLDLEGMLNCVKRYHEQRLSGRMDQQTYDREMSDVLERYRVWRRRYRAKDPCQD